MGNKEKKILKDSFVVTQMKVTVPLLLLACTIITLTQGSLLASLKTTTSILVANMSTNSDYWRSVY